MKKPNKASLTQKAMRALAEAVAEVVEDHRRGQGRSLCGAMVADSILAKERRIADITVNIQKLLKA
jgi:hypothetical protein